jgi:hypothetical protein
MRGKYIALIGIPLVVALVLGISAVLRHPRASEEPKSGSGSNHHVGTPAVGGEQEKAPNSTAGIRQHGKAKADIQTLKERLAVLAVKASGDFSPQDVIPILVEIESILSLRDSAGMRVVEMALIDRGLNWRARSLLSLLSGPYRDETTEGVLYSVLDESDSALSIGVVLALVTRRGTDNFDADTVERFWLETFHTAVFGEQICPKYFAETKNKRDGIKSFKAWGERIGPANSGTLILRALGAIDRTSDPTVQEDLLSLLRPPVDRGDEVVESLVLLYPKLREPQLRRWCFQLLERERNLKVLRFFEEQAVVEKDTELKVAAATGMLRWDSPGVEERVWKVYLTIQDVDVRRAVLNGAYNLDTEEMYRFLLRVVATETDKTLRVAAVASLGFSDPTTHKSAKEVVVQSALGDREAVVRIAAIETVGRLRLQGFKERIAEVASLDPSSEVRAAAARVIRELGSE